MPHKPGYLSVTPGIHIMWKERIGPITLSSDVCVVQTHCLCTLDNNPNLFMDINENIPDWWVYNLESIVLSQ